MTVKFDRDLAILAGVPAAVVFEYIRSGVRSSAADKAHYHQGFYRTKASVRELQEKMPYFTPAEIRSALNSLEKNGVIRIGKLGGGGSRAKWYTIIKQFGG